MADSNLDFTFTGSPSFDASCLRGASASAPSNLRGRRSRAYRACLRFWGVLASPPPTATVRAAGESIRLACGESSNQIGKLIDVDRLDDVAGESGVEQPVVAGI